MDAFQWNACFLTGLPDVDDQHHRLVDVINRFGELVTQRAGASKEELEAVFSELARYAQYHFSDEEAMMAAMQLDPRYIEQHKASHAQFLTEVTERHHGLAANNLQASKSLLQFLTHWLAYHILGSDQFMAKQVAAVKAGTRPEDAFLAETSDTDPATEALLAALHGLFEQVSERNHELTQLNKTLEARVAERTLELAEANHRLEDLANMDTLTGLPNRRYAMRSMALAWELATRGQTPLSCLMIDADGFKQVNDNYGHQAGDEVLRALSRQLQHGVRTDDIVCRLGGDEFLIICPGTPLEGALQLAEALRADVATLRVPVGAGEWRGSISVGAAARTSLTRTMEQLIQKADQGVYAAKRNGRNGVATADS